MRVGLPLPAQSARAAPLPALLFWQHLPLARPLNAPSHSFPPRPQLEGENLCKVCFKKIFMLVRALGAQEGAARLPLLASLTPYTRAPARHTPSSAASTLT